MQLISQMKNNFLLGLNGCVFINSNNIFHVLLYQIGCKLQHKGDFIVIIIATDE